MKGQYKLRYDLNDAKNCFLSAKCPCCGKDIMIPKDIPEVFCSYCGRQFLSEAARQYAAADTLYGKSFLPKVQVSTEKTPPVHPMPRMMSINQVASTGVLSVAALRTLIKQERLPAVYIGNKALINYDKLLEFLSSNSPDPEE